MVYFGFYNFTELVKLTNVLLDGLDQKMASGNQPMLHYSEPFVLREGGGRGRERGEERDVYT